MSRNKRLKVDPDKLFKLLDINRFIGEKLETDAVIEEVRQNPRSAAIAYGFRYHRYKSDETLKVSCYPLHRAIVLGANLDVVQAIYDAYPPAMEKTCGDCNRTALHYACQENVLSDVATFVLNKIPAAAIEKDPMGFLPLHFACRFGASFEVVSLLLDIFSDAARVGNNLGKSPFQFAIEWGSEEIVSLIMDHCPQAAREKDGIYRTPLHYACKGRASLDKVLLLLGVWPEAIMERDIEGGKPTHYYKKIYTERKQNRRIESKN